MRKNKNKSHIAILVTVLFMVYGSSGAKAVTEKDYVDARTSGDTRRELEITGEMIQEVRAPLELEVLMWRIFECSRHFSYTDTCLQLLQDCEKNDIAGTYPLLKDRARHLQKRLLLLSGEADKAMDIRNSMDTVVEYTLTDRTTGQEAPVVAAPSGLINIGSLTGEVGNNVYILETIIRSEKTKKCTLATGSTGRLRIRINGKTVLQDPAAHGFCEDQHIVKAILQKGENRVLINLKANRNGQCCFTLRNLSYRPGSSLPHASINTEDAVPLEKFYSGYCLYWNGYADSQMMHHLLKDPATVKLAPALCHFYTGLGESYTSREMQHLYHAASLAMPEALLEYVKRLTEYNAVEPALRAVHTLQMNTVTPYTSMARSQILNTAGLYHLAMQELDVLEEDGSCNRIYFLKGKTFARMGRYVSAGERYMKLLSNGGFLPVFIQSCARIQVLAGKSNEAETLLVRGVRCYPHAIELYIALAGIYRDTGRLDMAMGTLLAARNKCSWNPKVQKELGKILNMMGHNRAAQRYLRDIE